MNNSEVKQIPSKQQNRLSKFIYTPFSLKQKKVLTWWINYKSNNKSKEYKNKEFLDRDGIICDGAVRSGKTVIMSLSFVFWSMQTHSGQNFGLSGKSVGSFKRNVWLQLKTLLVLRGYKISKYSGSDMPNAYIIRKNNIENYYFIFGGKDERSQDFVQGFTSAGFFFDEVALMPESFVNQCIARCSVEGAKLWFNCNPAGPFHWFKLNWIDKAEEKNVLRIHFNIEDNPSLSSKVIEKYKRMFKGIFYERYILGLWVLAEGVIYSMFKRDMVIKELPYGVKILKNWIGVDYGQSNTTVFLLCGLGTDNKLYITDEYTHTGRTSAIQKSPLRYSKDFNKWLIKCGVQGARVRYESIFVDPSAKGFMLQLHEEGINGIRRADNEVLRGIELLSSILDNDMLRILSKCKNTINEFSTWKSVV